MSAADIPIPDLTIPHDATPCPFCGSSKAYANLDGGVWFGVCSECFSAAGPGADTPEDAMAQWNHRAAGTDPETTTAKKDPAPDGAKDAASGDDPAAGGDTKKSPENPDAKPRARRIAGAPGGASSRRPRRTKQRKNTAKTEKTDQ